MDDEILKSHLIIYIYIYIHVYSKMYLCFCYLVGLVLFRWPCMNFPHTLLLLCLGSFLSFGLPLYRQYEYMEIPSKCIYIYVLSTHVLCFCELVSRGLLLVAIAYPSPVALCFIVAALF